MKLLRKDKGIMRDIKFRGQTKTTESKKWAYGYYYRVKSFFNDNEGHYISTIRSDHLQDYSVDENTVGQYTGLKDKNGKEIYEGDIVQILGGEYEQGFYEWDEKVQIKDLIYDGYNLMMTISQIGNQAIEVIGNIYDNPELLKEEN